MRRPVPSPAPNISVARELSGDKVVRVRVTPSANCVPSGPSWTPVKIGSADWLELMPEAKGVAVSVTGASKASAGTLKDQTLPTTSVTLRETGTPVAGNRTEPPRAVSGVNMTFPRKSDGPAVILKLPD